MRINAIANHSNYIQNNNKKSKNPNFGELEITPDVKRIMEGALDLYETDAMTETAQDVFSIRDVVRPNEEDSYSLKRMKEYVLLNNLLHNGNIQLKYEPFNDFRLGSTFGLSTLSSLHYCALGGVFELLYNFVPSLPQGADNEFEWKAEGISRPLKVKFIDGDSQRFKVYAEEHGYKSDELVANTLNQFGFTPNKTCPVPTKEFVRNLVSRVYNYLITQNVSEMTDIDTELKALRKSYTAGKLINFVRTV